MQRTADPYPFPTIPVAVRHFVALTAVVIAYLASRTAPAVIDEGSLFLLMSITVLGAAWFAGTGSALAVTVLGAVLAGATVQPGAGFAVHMHLALFVVDGLLLTALVTELRRSQRIAERAAADAEASRHEAEAASRTKDEFLGTISHELRTPLNAVLGWLHLVRSGKLDEPAMAHGLDAIERNVRRQAQLTADLLDMSSALTGRLHLESQVVPLKRVIDEALSQVQPAALAKHVTLREASVPGQPMVRGDANRLRQVVWHLLENAIKFTPGGGAIYVSLEVGDMACITVRDTGPGVAIDFLPRLFERFAQADSSPTRGAGGVGVGLALVRELVERHGGDIRVSNHPRGGAIVTVRLPLCREEARVSPTADSPRAGADGRPGDAAVRQEGTRIAG